MRLAPCKARSPFGVPPRLSPKGIIPSQRLSFRPGFLGRGLNGRYPPSPVPVQGCTSRPGHSAGRLMPKPPENGVYGPVRRHRPRSAAGEYPRPTASLLSEICSPHVTVSETSVKGAVTVFMTRPAAAIVGQLTMLWIKSGVSSSEGRRPLFPRERPHRYIALSDALGHERPPAPQKYSEAFLGRSRSQTCRLRRDILLHIAANPYLGPIK